jgi:hypothetical protein
MSAAKAWTQRNIGACRVCIDDEIVCTGHGPPLSQTQPAIGGRSRDLNVDVSAATGDGLFRDIQTKADI